MMPAYFIQQWRFFIHHFRISYNQNKSGTSLAGGVLLHLPRLFPEERAQIQYEIPPFAFIVGRRSMIIIQNLWRVPIMEKTEQYVTVSPNQWTCNDLATVPLRKEKKIKKTRHSSEDQFEPEYHTLKKMRIPINRSRISKGNWSLSQNQVYLNFLKINKLHFISEVIRREERIFCKLSEALNKKRTPDQCRSHHQKLLSKHKDSLDGIIMELEKKVELNGAKEQPYMKIRMIGKYHYNKFLREKEDNKPTDYITSSEEDLRMERLLYGEVIREERVGDFYKTITFQNSGKIIIEIDSAAIQSY